jgi:hypothetical protein
MRSRTPARWRRRRDVLTLLEGDQQSAGIAGAETGTLASACRVFHDHEGKAVSIGSFSFVIMKMSPDGLAGSQLDHPLARRHCPAVRPLRQ